MNEAIRRAFEQGDFEGVLDRLSVVSMNVQRKEDGRTPLMAACVHGNKPIVDLLLDLVCSEIVKDKNGKTAMDYAVEAGRKDLRNEIMQCKRPPMGEDGKPVFTWDTCAHPPESKFLDEDIGWLICTACGLVLKENAIQLSGNDEGNPYTKMASVPGADAEYNAWRAEEMELADIMAKLGVVDNEEARRHGEETSIWAARKQALAWLDRRQRHLSSWAHRAKVAKLEGNPIPEKTAFPPYVRGVDYVHMQRIGGDTAMSELTEIRAPRFRGNKPMEDACVEDEELVDPAKIVAEKYASKPTRWRIAIDRWDAIGGGLLRWDRRRCREMVCAEREHQHALVEEEEEEEEEEEKEREREVEWEYS